MYRRRTQTREVIRVAIIFGVAAAAVAIDQATKYAVLHLLNTQRMPLLPFLDLFVYKNQGIAFGISVPAVVYAVLLAAVFVFMGVLYSWLRTMTLSSAIALGFVVGGGVSNILDRIFRGGVIDWIQFFHSGTINLADVSITIGIITLLFLLPRSGEQEKI